MIIQYYNISHFTEIILWPTVWAVAANGGFHYGPNCSITVQCVDTIVAKWSMDGMDLSHAIISSVLFSVLVDG